MPGKFFSFIYREEAEKKTSPNYREKYYRIENFYLDPATNGNNARVLLTAQFQLLRTEKSGKKRTVGTRQR